MKIRTGFGFDVHRLVEGRDLWLGGIKIEHTMGLLGHSDADVLIHAICDALLGAANMRDIGYHFPDTAGEFENIDSKILLKKTVALIATKGYMIGNIDATVCAERPKLKNHIPQMQQVLAEVMGIDADDVSIKATTTEKLGFTGREEGIAAYAVVLPFICIPAEVPITYYEVMSCGTPVVSYSNAGTTEYLGAGIKSAGRVSVRNLTKALSQLWADGVERSRLASNASALMARHPTWELVGLRWMEVLARPAGGMP